MSKKAIGQRHTLIVASVALLAVLVSGCQATTGEQNGAVIGAVAGGLLGNTVGKGSGRTAATIAGAAIGGIAGASVGRTTDRPQSVVVHQNQTGGECSHIQNAGVRASCERGVSERNANAQRQAEQNAYQCARYGKCQ